MMITITDKARTMIRRRSKDEGSFVRLSVTSGGCAGMTYNAEIDTVRKINESIAFVDKDITIVTDDESMPFLDGLIVDYSDDLITAGFRFSNGNNDSSCGCGASFALAGFPEISKEGMSCGT